MDFAGYFAQRYLTIFLDGERKTEDGAMQELARHRRSGAASILEMTLAELDAAAAVVYKAMAPTP